MARRNLWRIFAAPLWIALLSTVGLAAALIGDGLWDALSWTSLLIPVLICAYYPLRARLRGNANAGARD